MKVAVKMQMMLDFKFNIEMCFEIRIRIKREERVGRKGVYLTPSSNRDGCFMEALQIISGSGNTLKTHHFYLTNM